MKIKLLFITLFLALVSSVMLLNHLYKEHRISKELSASLKDLQVNYNIIMYNYRVNAEAIHHSILETPEVRETLARMLEADEEEKPILRKRLYRLLSTLYESVRKMGVKIVIITDPQNRVQLRMHKPDIYGDDVSKVRFSIARANATKTQQTGFEQGKISHGFRHVNPFFSDEGTHLGSIDITFSSEWMQQILDDVHQIHTHFLVYKEIIDSRVWNVQKVSATYYPSIEDDHYLISRRKDVEHVRKAISEKTIAQNKEEIDVRMARSESFAVYGIHDATNVVISFLPIQSIIPRTSASAYLVSYTTSPELNSIINQALAANVTAAVVIALILLQIYLMMLRKAQTVAERQRYKLLLEVSSDGIHILDAEGRLVECSEAFSKMLGYTHDEMLGMNITEWDRFMSQEEIRSKLTTLKYKAQTFKTRHLTKVGEELDVEVSVKGIEIEGEHYLYASSRDIGEQIRHETQLTALLEDLQDQKQVLKDYLASSADFVWEVDTQGTYTFAGEGVKWLLGYDPEELIGTSPFELIADDDKSRVTEAFAQTVKAEQPIKDLENWNIAKNGDRVCLLTNGVPFYDHEGRLCGYRGTDKDITAQKRYAMELTRAKEHAENATRVKSEFLANMSHEIRTPMTGILGFVDQLAKKESDPERLKQFDIIKNSGNTLLNIINDILDFSKIESGKMSLESHQNDIGHLFDETSAIFSELITQKSLEFEQVTQGELPLCGMVDEVRLKQVVFNLISNAIKFTPEGGKVTLATAYDRENHRLHCAVIDTGIGIAKENFAKIFDAFGQEDSSTTRKFGGTGLGLTICSRLIDLMGGRLEVESEVGQGSRFFFDISVPLCERAPVEAGADEDTGVEDMMFKGHALVVEDNKTNQMLLGIILDDLGVTYEIANDGVEGVKRYETGTYDIIMMDENMPNMNGIEATRRIRSIEEASGRRPTPIVAVTANALSQDRERFLAAGMDDYLSKPYDEGDIIGILKTYLVR
jgi:PAS domain S-box-containing protein